MNILIDQNGESKVAIIINDETYRMKNVQDALDLMSTVNYEAGAHKAVLFKDQMPPDFFNLKSGIAGEILQKYTNYQFQIAIVGDYSKYKSKSLQDFIRESNKGNQVFFVPDLVHALEALHKLG